MKQKTEDKITISQAVWLFVLMIYSPTMRIIPFISITNAKQAAWLCPITAIPFYFVLILIVKKFLIKYPNQSFSSITYDIMGKFFGKIIISVYLFWLLILLALYVRYFDERLVSSLYPNTNMIFFIIALLILVGVMLRSGIVTIARMNGIIFPIVAVQFFLIFILLIPNIKLKFIMPIDYLDIIPVFKGSLACNGIWAYFFFLFMTSDKIIVKEKMNKNFLLSTLFIILATTSLILGLLTTFGAQTVMQLPFPLLMAVNNISRSGNYQGLDAVFSAIWIWADFIIVSVFSYLVLQLLKSLFGLKNPTPLLSILMIFTYLLSLYICNEVFELQYFSEKFTIPVNIVLGYGIPLSIFIVGKVRKKL